MLVSAFLQRILDRRTPPPAEGPSLPFELLHMHRVVDEVAPAVLDDDGRARRRERSAELDETLRRAGLADKWGAA